MAADQTHALDEWTECRSTIGRIDNVLADIRKYGFSLVTILLTASALITTANPVVDRVAASSVVIALVLVLFLMDMYWWVLLRAAVTRAIELELVLEMQVSTRLKDIALASHNAPAAAVAYAIFIMIASAIALVTAVPGGQAWAPWYMSGFTVLAWIAVGWLHRWFDHQLPPEFQSGSPIKAVLGRGRTASSTAVAPTGRDKQ